jgi:PAS domain S-box-containing protein
VADLGVAMERLLAGESGAVEHTPPGGEPMLVGYAVIPDLDWAVVVEEPLRAALASAEGAQRRGTELLALAVALAMIVGWILGHQLSRPLIELRAATVRVAQGELGITVPVRSQDELGQVAASFNTMSAQLAASRDAEAALRRAAEAVAEREAMLNRINARVRASLDVTTILQATVSELGTALDAARCYLHLMRDGKLVRHAHEWSREGVPPASRLPDRPSPSVTIVAREHRTVVVSDVLADARLRDPALGWSGQPQTGTRSIMTAPVLRGDELLGMIGIHEVGVPRVWTPGDIALVERVAGEVAVALTNAHLYEEAQERARRLEAVARINRAISARLDLHALVRVVGETIGQFVPFDALALLRFDPDGRSYRVLGEHAVLVEAARDETRLPVVPGSRTEQLLRHPRIIVENDLEAPDYPLTPISRRLSAGGFRAFALIPVLAEAEQPDSPAEVLGALTLVSRQPGRYKQDEMEMLQAVVGQLSVALRNAELYSEVEGGQRRLAAVVGGIADGVFVIDPEGNIALWNPAAESILGYSADEALGRPWRSLVQGHHADGRAFGAGGEELRRGQALLNRDALIRTRAGDDLWLSLSVAPLEVDGRAFRVVVFRDISAYKQVEQLKSDFVATVSHELRTPLASIKGYAATLLQHGDRVEPRIRSEYLTIINEEADRLNAMVSELLDVARLERERGPAPCVPTTLAPIAERVVELARARTDRHELSVVVPDDLVVEAVPELVEQVLTNLVENAMKYSPNGGPVRVEGRPDAEGRIELAVSDRGIGIPLEWQTELFRPFARVESVLTRETEGAGLGLYICRQLVERMGGTIDLTSQPGQGTTVTVTLNAASREEVSPAASGAAASHGV